MLYATCLVDVDETYYSMKVSLWYGFVTLWNRFLYETFKYYSTIIGGRQSLVENGEIAPTVTEENTNGAQTTNIPRTSIGVIDEHNIILCSIESLRYNSKNNIEENDPYGVDLQELAEYLI